MDAVLRPGLCQCFQFDIGGVSAQFYKIISNRIPFDIRKSITQPYFFHRGFFVPHQINLFQDKVILRIGAENRLT